jgi:PhoPQ-activated pathogenicity-related protein
VGDAIAHNTRALTVVIKHVPNQPYDFPHDPEHRGRSEDDLLGWSWREFYDDPQNRTDWIIQLPMTKAAYQAMKAAQEWVIQ